MNPAYLHLSLNHIPVVGLGLVILLLLGSGRCEYEKAIPS
jgi:hypothetical protein